MSSSIRAVTQQRLSPALARLLLLIGLLTGEVEAVAQVPASGVTADGAAVASAKPVYPEEVWERITDPAAAGFSAAGLKQVRSFLESLDTTGVMVVVGGRVLFEYGDLEQLSYIASCRKSILAMLYGNYVKEGVIDLDMTLEEMGMDDVQGLLEHERQATVLDLITARSGIYHPASNPGDNTDQAPKRGSQQPGEYFLYNNWDFNAAGAVFEQETGKNIYDALQEDLVKPLGMRDFDRSGHRKSGDGTLSVNMAYHMTFSTRDMARLGYLMLRQGKWNETQVIPQEWSQRISSVFTPMHDMNPENFRGGPYGYGFMWWVWDGPRTPEQLKGAYTAMGAFGQFITVIPKLDLVLAHKTAVPPYERNVGLQGLLGIIERILAAQL